MTFNTLDFMLFLPAVFIFYYILPHKLRNPFLLLASYYFYAVYDLALTLFLVIITLVTYGIGRAIERNQDTKAAKNWMLFGVVLNVGTLAFYKYFNFFTGMVSGLFSADGAKAPVLNLLVPLGISFIIFQTVSYVIDVYRGKLPAEKSLFKFALYVAFFPKLVQGPIERAADILPQFDEVHRFDHKRFSEGLLMVIYGLFMKMVVADNAAVIVNTVYNDLNSYSGAAIAVATLCFTMQIYYDFAGYSYTAIGAAKILGFDFKQNFRQPYLSSSVAEFWRRWHISLNTWLRDYLYIPLGGNRCSKGRKRLNTLVTFTVSGLWHGADWGYIIWGFINGLYINLEARVNGWLSVRKANEGPKTVGGPAAFCGKVLRHVITFCLVSFAWIFFRAANLEASVTAVSRLFGHFNFQTFSAYVSEVFAPGSDAAFLGLNTSYGLPILIIGMLVVLVIDLITDKKNLAAAMAEGSRTIRWIVYLLMIFAIILFGVYGYGYNAGSFIYANF